MSVCLNTLRVSFDSSRFIHSTQQITIDCALRSSAVATLPASCALSEQADMSHFFIVSVSLHETRYTPISFSGVSIPASISFADELAPTPGISLMLQSCSGREMNVLNFLLVLLLMPDVLAHDVFLYNGFEILPQVDRVSQLM